MERTTSIPPPSSDTATRKVQIMTVVNDFAVGESMEFITDNIASWRTSLHQYKTNYNKHQVVDKEFTIQKQATKDTYRIWRTS